MSIFNKFPPLPDIDHNLRRAALAVFIFFVSIGDAQSLPGAEVIRLPGLPLNTVDQARGIFSNLNPQTNDFEEISDNKIVYAFYDKADATGSLYTVYGYDLATQTKEVLLTDKFAERQHVTPQLAGDGNKVFIVTAGELSVTDGTQAGTSFIEEFGTRFCCGFDGYYRSKLTLFEVIDGVLYFEVVNEINSVFRSHYISKSSLWRSDGTKTGTYRISKIHSFDQQSRSRYTGIQLAFVNKKSSSASIFYFQSGELWKINNAGDSQRVFTFDVDLFGLAISNLVKTQKGVYFSANRARGSRFKATLWHLSNHGELASLEANLAKTLGFKAYKAIYRKAESIYFRREDGWYVTSGVIENSSKKVIASASEPSFETDWCEVENLFYQAKLSTKTSDNLSLEVIKVGVDNKLSEISYVTDIAKAEPGFGNSVFLEACLEDGFIISSPRRYYFGPTEYFFYSAKQQRAYRISNFSTSVPLTSNSSMSNSRYVSGRFYPYLLRVPNGVDYLPPILDLMLK